MWTKKRNKDKSQLIFERLDRCAANDSWIKKYPNSLVTHLPRTKSDHCHMLVTLNFRTCYNSPKPFRLEPMSCGHLSLKELVQHSFPLLRSIHDFQSQATD